MARILEHINDCEELLGRPYKEVHEFLDQYAEVFFVGVFDEYHRTFLHNSAGLAVIEAERGREAKTAAEIHLVRDYIGSHISQGGLEVVKQRIGKVLMYFNNPENLRPNIDPSVVMAWGGKSLCQIAFDDDGYDEHFKHISEY